MNETYLYALDSTVWTIQEETNIVESWFVKQITITCTEDDTVVTYILRNGRGTFIYLEDDLFETLEDALESIA